MGWRQRRRLARKRVLIIGAGMAGLTAAAKLARKVDVTVADPSPWFEWLPNIHELLSGIKSPGSLRLDRQALLDAMAVSWLPRAVSRVDGNRATVCFDDGSEQQYDALLLAVGGVHDTRGVPGCADHALPFKSVDDCQRIALQLEEKMAAGSCRLVIVGAGVEGVEALGEVLRRYRQQPGLRVALIDSAEQLLRGAPAKVDGWIREHLEGLPVSLHMEQRVASVGADHVQLADGSMLAADLVIWTGGVAPPALLADSGLAGPGEWLAVEPDLQACRGRRVWAAGDLVDFPGCGKQAYHAMDMGELAATNLLAWFRGDKRRRFVPSPKPLLVTLGDLDSYLIAGDRVASGVALGQLKELIYQINMLALERGRGVAALPGLVRRLRHTLAELPAAGMLDASYWLRLPVLRIKI